MKNTMIISNNILQICKGLLADLQRAANQSKAETQQSVSLSDIPNELIPEVVHSVSPIGKVSVASLIDAPINRWDLVSCTPGVNHLYTNGK